MSASLYDSLVLGGVIELAGGPGGVVSTNPMCPGAAFTLDPGAWDLGDPQPTTDYTASLVLDGERPFGDRASDRTVQITVFIKAPDFLTLAGARELLYKTIDAQQWTMRWTPRLTQAQITAGQMSLPVLYDCFRARPSKMMWGGVTGMNNEPVGKVTIEFEALPYGRSDVQQQLAFTSPVAALNAPAPPPPPVVLDAFTSINSAAFTQTSTCVVGPAAGYWDPGGPAIGVPDGAATPLTYANTFSAPLNLTGMTSLKLWVGLGSRYYFNHHPRGRTRISLKYTLTDTSGVQLSWTTLTGLLPVSTNPTAPAFSLVAVRIPAATNGFNMAQVASYSLVMVNRGPDQLLPGGEFRWTCVTLDALTAYPSTTVSSSPTVRGTIYDVHGVAGTHYAPVSVTAQAPLSAGSVTVVTATGPGNYTVPAATQYVAASCIGGGGGGATMTVAGPGGGGGGGEEASEPQLPGSTTGIVIPYVVGAGGPPGTQVGQATTFGPVPGQTLVVTANGGTSATQNTAAGGAGGTGSVNSGHYPGGAGRTASGGLGGGGGSSAGPGAPGNTPTGTTSQTFTSSTSVTIPSGAGPVTIGLWGGGGGGAGGNYGGGGGGGEYAEVTLALSAGSYPFTVGAGGLAGTSGNPGHDGTATSITIAGTTYTANPGRGGTSGGPFGQGTGGAGGSGSSTGGEEPGGAGGNAYPDGAGGGSSAAHGAAGNAGNNYGAAGVAPTGGGNGGAGGTSLSSPSGVNGSGPGGGGGGAWNTGHSGGAGAPGQIKFTYSGPTSVGASPPSGGGAGGAGGATAGSAGSNGAQPGGGGGGGNSSGTTQAGGTGGNGQITVTPYGYPAFATLLLHRPGRDAPAQLSPLIPLGGVAPGAAEFPVPPITARTGSFGFEDGTTGGFATQNATEANSTAWANSGTHSLLLTSTGGGAWFGTSPQQPVSPGQFVSATVVVKNPNASASLASVGLNIDWYGPSGYLSTTSPASTTAISAGNTATLASAALAQAPAGATAFQLTVQDTTAAASTTMAFDDLSFTVSPPVQFDGTYTVLLAAQTWNTPSASRTITVTVNQYEAVGGTKWSVSTQTLTLTPATQVTNGLVVAGNLTLPYKALAKDNATCYYTVQITDSNTSDTFYDVLLLDNNGQTVLINESGSGYLTYYIDEPDPRYDLGLHLGSQNGRPQAISVMDAVQALSGGPLTLEPGDNKLLAWSLSGAPALAISYFPRWYQERLE